MSIYPSFKLFYHSKSLALSRQLVLRVTTSIQKVAYTASHIYNLSSSNPLLGREKKTAYKPDVPKFG